MIHALMLALCLVPGEQSSSEFVTRYRARQQALQTGMVRSTWEDFEDGKPTRRDYQTLYLDALGRRRLVVRSEQPGDSGTWVPHAQVPYEWDTLFDGELTASMTYDPRKDRVGNDAKGAKGGYRTAQIFDGEKDVMQQRTPIAFADGIVTRLEAAIQNHQQIDVDNESDQRISFRFPDDKDGEFWSFVVDKTRDWLPVRVAHVGSDGKAVMQTDFEYAQTSSGFWYPSRATHRHLGDRADTETPLRETRFEVTECRINDPAFDENVFKVSLAPDTAVSDLRYAVNYRVGIENAYTNQLQALANAALASRAADKAALEGTPITSAWGNGRWTLLGINVACAVALLIWLGYRRWTAR